MESLAFDINTKIAGGKKGRNIEEKKDSDEFLQIINGLL